MPVVPNQRAPLIILSNCALDASSPASISFISLCDSEDEWMGRRRRTLLFKLHRQLINLSLKLCPLRELILCACCCELAAESHILGLLRLLRFELFGGWGWEAVV